MRASIVDLRHRSALDSRRAGGKGSGLARLLSLGLDVPPGFVITTGAARDPQHGGLRPELERQLLERARRLGGRLAVRSSLVGEDSDAVSMAGQLVSTTGIEGDDELLAAVRRCYASVDAPRLAVYRGHLDREVGTGAEAAGPPLAVIVQRMQQGPVGGVAFSADPLTGERCVIVEAAASPDAVAGGRVNPARWRIDARGGLHTEDPGPTGEPLLPRERILELADRVSWIAGRLDRATDVEWCWDGRRFWFLQARPISTLAGRQVFSNRLVADMSPGLVVPLLWSTNTRTMARKVFGRIFDELLGPTGLDYGLLVRRIHSRLYANVTMLGDLLTRLGLPPNFFEIMARDERGHRPRFRPSPGRLVRLRRTVPFCWRHLRSRTAIRAHLRRQHEELERFRRRDWSGREPAELLARARELRALHEQSQWFSFLSAFNSLVRKRILDRMVRRHAPQVDPGDLIRGLAGLKALEPNHRLQELAAIARELPAEQRDRLLEDDPATIEAWLAGSETGRRLREGFARFLDEYGFLSANGTDFSRESWFERPELVWRYIGRHQGMTRLVQATEAAGIRRRARRQVRDSLHPLQRGVFGRLLRSAVVYLGLRERVSMLLSEDAYEMRRVFLAIGQGLVDRFGFAGVDDVFYLYFEEIERLVAGELSAEQARQLVADRRDEMRADAELQPADTICGDPALHRPVRPETQGEHLTGITGSTGVIQGRARIVHDPLHAPPDLGRRDILVVPFTDVGWTPLFASVGGIIAEAGGQLSHTAIVAREYNLPAVVNVPGATRLLKEYQRITLDGTAGRVYLGHGPEGKEMPA